MREKWPYSYCFDKTNKQHLCVVLIKLFLPALQPCNSTNIAIWQQLGRITVLLFYQLIVNLSKAVHALRRRILTSHAVDEIWLPWYMKWFSNFGELIQLMRRWHYLYFVYIYIYI